MTRRIPIYGTRDPALGNVHDALERSEKVDPALAPELRNHSVATLVEARRTRGSRDGKLGPRMMMLAGFEDPVDGGEGVFIWHDTSTDTDDEGVATIEPAGVKAGRWKRAQLYPTQTGQLLRAPQILTAGTSISHPAGTRLIRVIGVGAGGAGGGCAAVAGAMGSQGGGATYGERTYTASSLSSTYTIGAGGVAVSGAGGGNGGSSTFTHGGVTMTLPGGVGGQAGAGAATVAVNSGGIGGGAATNADFSITGEPGGPTIRPVAATSPQFHAGRAGSTPLGHGAAANGTQAGSSPGNSPTGYGSGGGGALNGTGAGAQAGVNGAPGVWLVWEYS